MPQDDDFRPSFPDNAYYDATRYQVHAEYKLNPGDYKGIADAVNERRKEPISYDRRNFLLAGLATVLSGVSAGYTVVEHYEASASRASDRWSVDASYATKWSRLNYNDPLFSTDFTEATLNNGTRALFRSFYYHQQRMFDGLAKNLRELKTAAENTDDLQIRAFVHARRMIDANALSLGDVARESYSSISWDDVPAGNRIFSTLLDYGSTVAMNILDTDNFDNFADPKVEALLKTWNRDTGIRPNDFKVENLVSMIDNVGAGVFTIIQAHFIGEFRKTSDSKQRIRIRKDWVDAMTLAATEAAADASARLPRQKKEDLLSEIAEDYLHSLCRPAFHALRAEDEEQYSFIRNIYFGDTRRLKLKPHVLAASRKIQAAMPPGAQWMSLLDVASILKWGHSAQQQRRQDAVVRFGAILQNQTRIKNAAIAQTALALEQRVGTGRPIDELRKVASPWSKAVGMQMHRPYYDTIASV